MRRLLLLGLVACGSGESEECEKYLACAEALVPMSTMRSSQTYGPGGTCWNSSDPAMAADCTDICKKALAALKASSGASTPACQ